MNLLGLMLDALLVAGAAWLVVRALAAELRGLESALGFGLAALMLVVGAGVLLGATGGLGLAGFLTVHGVIAAGLLGWRARHWREDLSAVQALPGELWRELAVTPIERVAVLLLGAVAVTFLLLASTAQPVVFDALTYRLSRVGHWLQEGRITTIVTDDARLNYMPVAPDLVMAWLLSGTNADFQLSAVAQAFGGLLALGATLGLARLTGLSRLGALGAVALLLGLPNLIPQFTSAYTDLFTAGVLAAGYYLWLAALQRGQGSWLGGAAAGLALGAKGTVVYFAPGLVLATAWLAWRHRAGLAAWGRTMGGAALAVLVFVVPLLVRNQQAYGYLLGSREFVVLHQGGVLGLQESEAKLRLNLTSAFAQLCEPNSQPPWWRDRVRQVGEAVIRLLPTEDPYAFEGLNRRANLEKIYAVAAPDADVATPGVLLPVLALAATVVAWRRRRTREGELALVWAVALAVFVIFLHWRLQWHPYLFRFLVLGAPWLVVLVAWWLQALPRRAAVLAWVIAGATALQGFSAGMITTYQSGWPATMRPTQSMGYYVFAQMRALARSLDQTGEPLRPALDVNAPLAAFYRLPSGRRVLPEKLSTLHDRTPADLVRPGEGWLIAPVAAFIGHEGNVMGRVSLFDGDERHPYSIAAWRALRPGEHPVPLVYRDRVAPKEGAGLSRQILVRCWSGGPPIILQLINPTTETMRFIASVNGRQQEMEVAPGSVQIELLPDQARYAHLAMVELQGSAVQLLEVRLLP